MSEQNLSVLFNTLEQARKTKEINGIFKISELTMSQQRELLVTVFDPLETPAKLSNAFNKIIRDCTEIISKDKKEFTLLDKAPLLRELRDLSIGDTFIKTITDDEGNEEKVEYKFTKLDYKKIDKIKPEQELKVNDAVKIILSVPTIDHDIVMNNTLLKAISVYKRNTEQKREPLDRGYITSLYLMYEILKYIDRIYINDIEYIFNKLSANEQLRVVNNLPQEFSNKITDFIQTIKNVEDIAFTAINLKTKEEEQIGLEYNIFSKEL